MKQDTPRGKTRAAPAKSPAKSPKSPASPRKVNPRGERATRIAERLRDAIPDPRCELDFENPFQLLIATILSAQTTDKGVNKATPELFRRYPTPRALADAPQEAVEALVKTTGFFRQKARNIREAARIVAEEHGGEVPRSMEALIKLPGVARKTANVVLGTAFGIPSGMAVDTHVARVSQRLGLSRADAPLEIEQDLLPLFPQTEWTQTGHRLVLHGRYTCLARAPRCAECNLADLCPAAVTPRKNR